MKTKVFFFIFLILMQGEILAKIETSQYNVFVSENGNSVVGIIFEGEGEIIIPLQEDVESLIVEGGLYVLEKNSAIIAIGPTNKVAVVYKTSLLTKKIKENWEFEMNLENYTLKKIMIALPKKVIVKETNPRMLIETKDYVKLYVEDFYGSKIDFNFSFSSEILNDMSDLIGEEKELSIGKRKNNFLLYGGILFGILLAILFFMSSMKKTKTKKKSMEGKLLDTLTENESKVVRLLLESKKDLKRNFIEKKLNFAKSSLAATINNLERKKVIEVDRSYTIHTIKLGKLFDKK